MKIRIDIILVQQHLAESRAKAQWLIKNGFVLVNGTIIKKPGKKVSITAKISLTYTFPYVGRGGIKLEAAIRAFTIDVKNKVCVDIGASIGGFIDCLIKHGAKKVYAIDTAMNSLHSSLKSKEKVNKIIPLFGIDARKLNNFEEKIDICTIDVTFTSLKNILPNVKKYLKNNGEIIVLLKPLFETDFYEKNYFKVIKDSKILEQILIDFLSWSSQKGFFPYGIILSPLLGKRGSIEFLILFRIDNKKVSFNYSKEINQIINKIQF